MWFSPPFCFSSSYSKSMKWDMEIDEIEAILEKIWDLHDKLSEAIHLISRSHFLNSVQNLRNVENNNSKLSPDGANDNPTSGFVFVKEFRIEQDESAIHEAKSLNAIRTALENLEDQLEFFHTVQLQQRAERDAAIARLEQSRIVLAMRLAEHHGRNYKVIEEALAFVGKVNDGAQYVSSENKCGHPFSLNGEKSMSGKDERPNFLFKFLFSSFNFAKKSLKLDHIGGILGNAAMVAVSMVVFLHLQQVSQKEHPLERGEDIYLNRTGRRTFRHNGSSSNGQLSNFDVLSAKG